MKIPFKDLLVGSCFLDPKGEKKKKISETKAALVKDDGKVSVRKMKPGVEVEEGFCEVKHLGVGLRRHPEMVVEIGDGNPFKKGRKKK